MIPKTHSLSPLILQVVRDKGTEKAFSGEYLKLGQAQVGTYLCRQCGIALFRTTSQFHSGCGWASFDDAIEGTVAEESDADGTRTEILCNRCHAHLGHVFRGEGFTDNGTRHCVNSLSLDFVANTTTKDTEEAIIAAGCFWGVEYLFKQCPGVLKTEVGYTGGNQANPTYSQVSQGDTGHLEALRILYDPRQTTYRHIIQYFFEIHDPTQIDGQGPDQGGQYHSAIFYYDTAQKTAASDLMMQLEADGYSLATRLLPVGIFWPAEDYHRDYYAKTDKAPYCHRYTPRFKDK